MGRCPGDSPTGRRSAVPSSALCVLSDGLHGRGLRCGRSAKAAAGLGVDLALCGADGLLGLELAAVPARLRVWLGHSALSTVAILSQSRLLTFCTFLSDRAALSAEVWTMIVLYVVMGTAPMMLFGFIAVAGIVQGQLASIPVIRCRQTLGGHHVDQVRA